MATKIAGSDVIEHPIIFSGPMVQAILDGKKTQTRRVIKPQPHKYLFWSHGFACWIDNCSDSSYRLKGRKCPYGVPGDRLWVRETLRTGDGRDAECLYYVAGGEPRYPESGTERSWLWKRTVNTVIPSIHMPRWAARIFLEVVSVRVEWVQDITETEAISEGAEGGGGHPDFWVGAFRDLWDSINAKRNRVEGDMGSWPANYGPFCWEANPHVWVVEFKVVTK